VSLYGKGVAAYGPESVGNKFWYNDRIMKYPHNPKLALGLLTASGYTQRKDSQGKTILYDSRGNAVRFSLHTNAGNPIRESMCNLIAGDLAKLGIQVDYSVLDFRTLVDRVTVSYDFDSMLLGLSHDDTDPAGGMNIWMSSGSLHFWWPLQKSPQTSWEKRIDELMNLQLATYDLKKRKEYYDEVQEILADRQPVIFTITQFIFVCARENLHNLAPSVSRHRTLWNAEELYWGT
jgi:peptide/nickel transport system substrate-binding protein